MARMSERIETHGDLSPGYVGGDFKVTNIHIQQRTEAVRKQWRELDWVDYIALADDDECRSAYAHHLAVHLHRVFGGRGYTRFTSFVRPDKIRGGPEGEPAPVYRLLTHQAVFSGALRQTWRFLWNPHGDRTAQRSYQDELNEQLQWLGSQWSVDLRPVLVDDLAVTEFVYDPDGKHIAIRPPSLISTARVDFPEKLWTTSELLVFLSAVIHSPVIDLGQAECLNSHYALLKLVFEMHDKRSFRLGQIRVNAADPEEWDYISPDADRVIDEYAEVHRER